MRLERMRIGSFGILGDLQLEPGPGLTVISGSNESGKSTLASFIPALIFGFPDARSNLNPYPSLARGRRGGWIEFRSGGHSYRAERWYEHGGKIAGELSLFCDDDDITDDDARDLLVRLWGGLSQDAHRNLLTFGLSELEDVRTLETEKIARLLYTTAAGIDARALDRIHSELRRRKMEIHRPRAQSRIGDLLDRLDNLARERPGESELAEHRRLREELERERRAMVRAREHLRALVAKRDSIEAARRAQPLRTRMREIDATLAELDVPADFPAEATIRWKQVREAMDETDEELEQIRAEMEGISAKLRHLAPTEEDSHLLGRAQEIRRLYGELSAISEKMTRRDKLTASWHRLHAEASATLSELGDGWGEDYTKIPRVSLELRETIRDTGRRWEALEKELEGIRARKSELEQTKMEFSPQESPDEEDPRTAAEDVTRRIHYIDELLELKETRDRLEERLGYVALLSQSGTRTDFSSLLPTALLALLGLVGALYSAAMNRAILAWIIGLSGTGAALGYWLFDRRRTAATSSVDDSTDSPAQLRGQIEETSARCSQLATYLFEDPCVPPREDLLEKRHRLEECRLRYAKQEDSSLARSRIDETIANLEREEDLLARQMQQLSSQFSEELRREGFPPDTTPRRASLYLDPLDRLGRVRREIEGIRSEIAELDRQLDSFVEEVCRTLDRPRDGIEPERARDMILRAEGKLGSAEDDAREQEELAERRDYLKNRRDQLLDKRKRLDDNVADLFGAGGTDDPEVFRRRAERAAPANELRKERSELKARLKELSPSTSLGCGDAPSEEELERARDAVERAERQLDESAERVGNLRARLEMVESTDAPAVRALKMETAKSSLRDALREWMKLTSASWLLERAREMGERERTPTVLRRASEMIARVTGGQYLSVSPDPSRATLRLETGDGRGEVSPDQLSRGTLAGVYLAIRLAVLGEMARRSEPVPVVMDDPLVNLDAGRLKAAVNCIREASNDFQILFLTCHRRIPRLLAEDSSVKFVEFDSK
ncbi:MAG: AAA family ATPase [Bacillota bacterium]